MDGAKNIWWIIPFKKFGMVRVKSARVSGKYLKLRILCQLKEVTGYIKHWKTTGTPLQFIFICG